MKRNLGFKILYLGRKSPLRGVKWPKVGVWTERCKGDPELCECGWHLVYPVGLEYWWDRIHWKGGGVSLWIAQGRGAGPKDVTKGCFRQARLLVRVKRPVSRMGELIGAAGSELVSARAVLAEFDPEIKEAERIAKSLK